jgi:hypothetical protein
MRKSKTALISDYFSQQPLYRRAYRLVYLCWALAAISGAAGLALVLLNGGIFDGGFAKSGTPGFLCFSCAFLLALAAFCQIFSIISAENNARHFMQEKIRKTCLTLYKHAYAIAEERGSTDIHAYVLAGYTHADVCGREARFWRDDLGTAHATNFEATAFLFFADELVYIKTQLNLDVLDSETTTQKDLPYAAIHNLQRLNESFTYVDCRKKRGTGEHKYLLLNSDKGELKTSIAYFDPNERASDRDFAQEIQAIRAEIMQRQAT